MPKVVVLIDFENIFYNRKPTVELLKSNFFPMLDVICEGNDDIEQIDFRLYDGWRSGAHPTQRADMVSSILTEVEQAMFPLLRNKRKIQGTIQLATSLIGIEYEWDNTMRAKTGIHRLAINDSCKMRESCLNIDKCPLHLISRASRGEEVLCPIDGCGSIDFSRLVRKEQKMVDAMMGSDLLELGLSSDYNIIVLVTDDTDMYPLLLQSSLHKRSDVRLLYLTLNNWHKKNYSEIFKSTNIETLLWQ